MMYHDQRYIKPHVLLDEMGSQLMIADKVRQEHVLSVGQNDLIFRNSNLHGVAGSNAHDCGIAIHSRRTNPLHPGASHGFRHGSPQPRHFAARSHKSQLQHRYWIQSSWSGIPPADDNIRSTAGSLWSFFHQHSTHLHTNVINLTDQLLTTLTSPPAPGRRKFQSTAWRRLPGGSHR